MPLQSLWNLIPSETKNSVFDALIEAVVSRGEGLISDSLLDKIGGLRSDANFRKRFEAAMQTAIQRFLDEYVDQDEDLVEAIAEQIDTVFADKQVRKTLLAIIRNPSGYHVENKDKLIDAFDTVLMRRRNRERVDRAVSYLLKCIAEEVWHLPELQPVYLLQMARVSAEANTLTAQAVQEQLRIAKLQLQATAELNAGIRDAMLQLSDGLADRLLLEAGEQAKKPTVLHNLPQPDYEQFIGRKQELADIHRLLRPYPHSQIHQLTLLGIGGIGKTTLALECAHHYLRQYHQLFETERFEAIVWTSGKQTVLTGQGILEKMSLLNTLSDVYRAVAIVFGREDITQKESAEQAQSVQKLLTERRTLFIFDNLETIDDDYLFAFIRELPAPTKAIVTTRHQIDSPYTISLTAMSEAESLALIEREEQRQQVALTKQQKRQLFERTGGVPLAMVWTIAQIGYGYDVDIALSRLGDNQEDVAQFVFGTAISLIRNTSAFDTLMVLSLFPHGVRRQTIGHILGESSDELTRNHALVTLERLSLASREQGRYTMQPLTLTFAQNERRALLDQGQSYMQRLFAYYERLCLEAGRGHWRWYDFDVLVQEGESLIDATELALAQGATKSTLTIMTSVFWYLDIDGRWAESLQYGDLAIDLATRKREFGSLVGLYRQTGWIYGQMGEFERAITQLNHGLRICSRLSEKERDEAQVGLLETLGQVRRRQGNFAAAHDLYSQAQRIIDERNLPPVEQADLDFEWGKLARAEERWEDAIYYLNRVVTWSENAERKGEVHSIDLASGATGNLARAYYHLGQYELAREKCLESMEFFERMGGASFLVMLKYNFALIEEALENFKSALEAAEWAYKTASVCRWQSNCPILKSFCDDYVTEVVHKIVKWITQHTTKLFPLSGTALMTCCATCMRGGSIETLSCR